MPFQEVEGWSGYLEAMEAFGDGSIGWPVNLLLEVQAQFEELVTAVVAYQKKFDSTKRVRQLLKLDRELERKRNVIVRGFYLARNLYEGGDNGCILLKEADLKSRPDFLESNIVLRLQQENTVKQMGTTVTNASSYMERLKERPKLKRLLLLQNLHKP
nr:putative glutamine amidotransferase PB2B2.05 [Tanacetum cinerariifolium]